LEKDRTALKIYFLESPVLSFLEDLRTRYPHVQMHLSGEQNKDWLSEWKKSFQPFSLAGGTWVVPSWCEVPSEAKKVIRIDPGMAFGTGTHETTRLAAGFLEDCTSTILKNNPKATACDVGTGTGILAIQAGLLGFCHIDANDIDPEARRVSRENVDLNQSNLVKILDADVSDIHDTYDCVIANIIDGVLVKIQMDLKRIVKPQGYLILTGILAERENLFRSEFLTDGFREIERRALGEWVGLLWQKT
jgi:ribosomal protein L11 methyltransferase